MTSKFQCPKCGRRFTEWGAEKVGFKCPRDKWCPEHTGELALVKMGSGEERPLKKPSLKRGGKKLAVVQPVDVDEDEALVPDIEEIEEEEEDVHVGEAFVAVADEDVEAFVPNPADLIIDDAAEAEEVELEVGDEIPLGEAVPELDAEIEEHTGLDDEWAH